MRYEIGESQAELAGSSVRFSKGGKWSGRTILERVLIVLGVLLVLGLAALAIALGCVVANTRDSDVMTMCNSQECAQAAARILSSLDMSVNPCENFYDFACGTWRKRNVIPEDRSSINVFGILRDEVEVILKYLLEVENGASDLSVFKTVRDMYGSCVNEDLIEKRNISVAIPLLEELGGWPVLGNQPGGNWKESEFDLIHLLVGLMKYSNRPLIRMLVSSDVKESTKRIIYLDQPRFGISSRSYLVEPKYEDRRQAYKKLAVSMAVHFGANLSVAETDMQRVLEFEIDIANITMKPEDRRDSEKLYNKMSVYELSMNITEPSVNDRIQFSWLRYIESVMTLPNVSIPINESEPVVVIALPYFQKMFAVFQMYDERTIANYLVWRIMQSMTFHLPKRFKDLLTDYNEVVYGTSTPRARWRDCADYVNGQMGMAVGRLFIEETFDETAKSSALAMISDIREAFDDILQELDWLDNKTRTKAEEKASAIRGWIGYPDGLTNDTHLESIYESVTVDRDTHFENILNNLKRTTVADLHNLREEYTKNVTRIEPLSGANIFMNCSGEATVFHATIMVNVPYWTTPPATVNAFYHSILNVIMFPAGILQPPFYARDQPKSMNYGGIGVVIGHEITHGFDDVGRQYDKDGNLQHWWTNDVIDRFKMKARCIIDQYGSYLLPEANMTLNGINTQGENIADNGGLKQSFRAYRRWVEKRGKEEQRLPGLNYNHNQIFFINFAQIWCANLRPEAGINSILNGAHSPGRFRVIGTLQNSREFAESFGCKRTDYMNPDKKCYVW